MKKGQKIQIRYNKSVQDLETKNSKIYNIEALQQ